MTRRCWWVLIFWIFIAANNNWHTNVNAADSEASSTSATPEKQQKTKEKKVAIVTLVTTSTYIPGALVLSESLRRVKAKGEKVLLWVGPNDDPRSDLTPQHMQHLAQYWDKTVQLSKETGTYTECRISPEQRAMIDQNPTLVGLDRYWGTCSKFAVWTLTDYDVVIYMDADSIAMDNFDFCFDYLDAKDNDNKNNSHDYSFAAHAVPECWTKDPPECETFYTAFMVIKPLPNVQTYFHTLASQHYLAEGEITLLNQVIQNWKMLPRFTLVAQTETVRPVNPTTGSIDWKAPNQSVKVYDFAGKPDTKPWVSHALSKEKHDPYWHSYFGSMIPGTEAFQRYMIPQLLWNQYYDDILERERKQQQQQRKKDAADKEL